MNKLNNKGFTLVEIMIVIAVIGILSIVIIPSYIGYKGTVNKVLCDDNCEQAGKKYEIYLLIENQRHSEGAFMYFLDSYTNVICPDDGLIEYWDGNVQCSVHSKDDDSESDDEDVPFL